MPPRKRRDTTPALQPGSESLIQCNLVHTKLSEKSSYEALSYMWGSESNSKEIEINGCGGLVRENLWQALRHLRLKDKTQILWIDALCINQPNIHERNHQVTQMSQIYAKASKNRLWIIQELYLASEAEIYCGNVSTNLDKFFMTCRDIWRGLKATTSPIFDLRNTLKVYNAVKVMRLRRDRITASGSWLSPPGPTFTLFELINQFHRAKYADTQDQVSGLRSLALACCREAIAITPRRSLHLMDYKTFELENLETKQGLENLKRMVLSVTEDLLPAIVPSWASPILSDNEATSLLFQEIRSVERPAQALKPQILAVEKRRIASSRSRLSLDSPTGGGRRAYCNPHFTNEGHNLCRKEYNSVTLQYISDNDPNHSSNLLHHIHKFWRRQAEEFSSFPATQGAGGSLPREEDSITKENCSTHICQLANAVAETAHYHERQKCVQFFIITVRGTDIFGLATSQTKCGDMICGFDSGYHSESISKSSIVAVIRKTGLRKSFVGRAIIWSGDLNFKTSKEWPDRNGAFPISIPDL
ncbi:uncharacterized protein PAC_17958 [Phialocephala subalpina]|uniref:Heterokaryon incompatibility domain-containing protein n=1 Tax=Phialocephala subalpina TaxID=576137 RepID=A0A1L7XST4_9HELO|nr:uncharacterized protein PAC_17958 [Phialocephala subalpina]